MAEAYSLRNRSRSSSNLKNDILTSFLYPFKDVVSNNHEIIIKCFDAFQIPILTTDVGV